MPSPGPPERPENRAALYVDAGDGGRVNAYDFFTGHQGDEGLDVAFVVFCPDGPDGDLLPWTSDPDPLPNE